MYLKYDNCPNCFEPLNGRHTCGKCGFSIDNLKVNDSIISPFTLLNDRYLLGRVLGQGGFGITYVAQDMRSGRLCAIKEYMPSECAVREPDNRIEEAGSGYRDVFEKGKEKFLLEARTLYDLSKNPVVVTIYDYFRENNTAYLVMELLEGANMKALSHSYGGKIPLELAEKMLVTIAQALVEIHSKGVLHRDISPENIFITKKEEIRLIDFGAARNFITSQNTGMSVLLKPGFAPPEQYGRGNQGPWTDIYALAASFYTLVSGQKLIDSMMILRGEKQPSLYELNCGISKELSDAIEKAMSLNYKERYQTCSEFLNDINEKRRTIHQVKSKEIYMEKPNVSAPRYAAYIKALSGKQDKMRLPPDKVVNIGRSYVQSDFVVELDSAISRQHCSIIYDEKNNNFRLTDQSANGTYLRDGQRLVKGRTYIIKPGERFYLVNSGIMLQVDVEPVRI